MSGNVGYRPTNEQHNGTPIGMSASLSSGELRGRRRRWWDPLRRVWTGQPTAELGQGTFQQHCGGAYNATNHHHAPATTIQHASNITMVNQGTSDDSLFLWELPRHPDISGEWSEYVKNSRDKDIRRIWKWGSAGTNKDLLLWIHSVSGLGKSTLACQLKDEARSLNRLASAIFFSRLSMDSWGPETLIRLIGGETGRIHRQAVPTIAEAIRQCHGVPLQVQVERFIRDPILALQLPYPLIVILDGAEEWKYFPHFIEQLAHLAPYTSIVRFIVLGRSKPTEGRYKQVPIQSYALAPVSAEVMAGYLDKRFATIKWKDGGRPTPEMVLSLAALADGQFTRMEEVVSVIHDLPPSNHDDISHVLDNKASTARRSSEKSNSSEELEHAILLRRVALALRPPGHPKRWRSLNNLSVALNSRYTKSKSTEDLEECTLLDREALALRPPGHPERHYSCYNLSRSLYDRFQNDGLVGDLDKAISLGREALQLRPEGHPDRFITVTAQQIYLYDSFKSKGAVEDLREAITLAEEALSICPKDDRDYARLPARLSSYKAELATLEALPGTKHNSQKQ